MLVPHPFHRLLALALIVTSVAGCATLNSGDEDSGTYPQRNSGEDGRFTIGTGNKRLMYGYPVPYSTSHFVANVDGKFASNSPRFPHDVEYLTGTLYTKGAEASAQTKISFDFNDVHITQRLIPVDKDFKDVPVGGWGQYYRIEYELTNTADATRSVGLALLIDTMIDDNDACQMDADGRRVADQTAFEHGNIPGEVLVYRVPGSTSDLAAVLVTQKGKAVKPDALYAGRWPYLHSVTWDVSLASGSYTDSGLLLKWDLKPLAPGEKRVVATHYGLPRPGKLSMLTNAEGFQTHQTNVYFDLGKADLNDAGKQAIDALLATASPAGVFVEVYTDARGNEALNNALSKRRAETVTAYLKSRSVPAAIIIPKSYGEAYADQSEEARKLGKQEDRRASIVIYSR
ncbi:MAG: OmpA family protein [Bacteroidetes bacterium]|nr:OmpA family protein [Bacteroidota bacterium]